MAIQRRLSGPVTTQGRHAGQARHRNILADLVADVEQESWKHDAACAQTDPDAFFPDDENPLRYHNRLVYRVCQRCPVQTACRDYATRHHLVGIWGGTNTNQRRTLRRRQRHEAA